METANIVNTGTDRYDGYLARLGLAPRSGHHPSLEALFALHRAHAERVAYENLEIQLGRATSADPDESIGRIVRGRGGYCFHLNGAFGTLLQHLGYSATRHLGEVCGQSAPPERTELEVNHQVLVVACEGERWLVDVGLGDGLYEPMPLREGASVQGPFTYRLEPWAERPGGWLFLHDSKASVPAMVFAPEPVHWSAFSAAHEQLSTSPDSGFVRVCLLQRRAPDATLTLRGLVYERVDGEGRQKRTLETAGEWFACAAEEFGLPLTDVDAAARERLWGRLASSHAAWLAAASGRSEESDAPDDSTAE
ncbi:arylamine N-acetyltransferase [Actinospica durhamensis]|uniref:Arylamine N-acetyltransferase n=1 Tax=Actinospica durhamensis TaxID=1508375 RepID=A0A941ET46_9ACTN|nr:arylamine N-acetyltransferase [Actinospica durhamensis]MBR7835998.1 arylamine N-acetyltransferase [Actinospica durhamensis]